MLEIKNVVMTFNKGTINEKVALNDVSLKIEDGEFITIIGGNGSGKSTLMNVIAGTYFPDSGSVIIDGKDVTNVSEYKRAKYLGRVFQDPNMGTAPGMQIDENLSLALRKGKRRTLAPAVRKKEREEYKELLKSLDLGLENRLTTKVNLLSGGQRQAITLLMASLTSPKLLLLDEHTAALDPKTANKVLELTNEIVTSRKLTTFMITHNMKDAITYGNRLIMLNNGRIVFDVKGEAKKNLTVEDLLKKFKNDESIVLDDKLFLNE